MADLVHLERHRIARRENAGRGPVREFLAIGLGGQQYGVELTGIREILSLPPLTPVPRAPRHVLGVCSVRGQLVTVIDLRRRLRLSDDSPPRRARVLLTELDSDIVGLFVDEVRQVMRLSESEIEPAAAAMGGEVSDHVIGIARPQGQVVVLINLSTIVPR